MRNQTFKFITILLVLLFWATIIEAQSRGTFTITKSVVAGGGGSAAGGGGSAAGGGFMLDTTIGQSIAGTINIGEV